MVISYYSGLQEIYGWTQRQIDDSDFEYLLDLIVVNDKLKYKDSETSFETVF